MLKSARPIVDKDIWSLILSTKTKPLFNDANEDEFISSYIKWIDSSNNFKIFGLDKLYAYITDGITDAFNNFHLTYPTRETIVMAGEYPQHKRMGATTMEKSIYIRSRSFFDLGGSKFIVSYPFSATGTVPEHFEDLMGICSERNIPVFLDCAFHGISNVEPIDISAYECIKFVGFSLSKTFATGIHGRLGICFTKEEQSHSPMCINTEWKYFNHTSINLHNILIQNFSADYIYNKYRKKQVTLCNNLNITPSDTVIFGITNNAEWDEYKRNKTINRICLSIEIQE